MDDKILDVYTAKVQDFQVQVALAESSQRRDLAFEWPRKVRGQRRRKDSLLTDMFSRMSWLLDQSFLYSEVLSQNCIATGVNRN